MSKMIIGGSSITWGRDVPREQVLAEIAQAGFEGAPSGARPGVTAQETVEVYARFGLKPGPGYLGANFEKPEEEAAILERAHVQAAFMRDIGCTELYVAAGGFDGYVTSRGKTSIEQHFDTDEQLTSYLRETGREEQLLDLEFERDDMQYFYTRQRRQLGLGHAVLCARPLVGEQPFVVALGDSIIGLHAQSDIVARMVERFHATGADVVVAFERVPRAEVVHYGIAKPRNAASAVFELEEVIEKPAVDEAPSELAVAARYVFSPAIFEALERTPPGKGGEIQLTDAIRLLLQEGRRGLGVTGEQMGQSLKFMVPLMLGQLGIPALQQQVTAAANAFLDNPQSFSITARPANPVAVPVLLGAGMGDPKSLVDLLNVQVTANEPVMLCCKE